MACFSIVPASGGSHGRIGRPGRMHCAPVGWRSNTNCASTWRSLRWARVIVPGDHWYEWLTTPHGSDQPYAIRRGDRRPLFRAGLCSIPAGSQPRTGDGFVLVTATADQGL